MVRFTYGKVINECDVMSLPMKISLRMIDFPMYLMAGFDTEVLCPVVWPGGETEALTRIEKQFGEDFTSVNIRHCVF